MRMGWWSRQRAAWPFAGLRALPTAFPRVATAKDTALPGKGMEPIGSDRPLARRSCHAHLEPGLSWAFLSMGLGGRQ